MNERLVTWLLIMPAIREIYFLLNQKFNKPVKFIAHEIFALYGILCCWY